MFQRNSNNIEGCFGGVLGVFQRCGNGVIRKSQRGVKDFSIEFQGSFMLISRKL